MTLLSETKIKLLVVSVIALLCILGVFLMKPVAQNLQYHNFADQRMILGIPHFYNVISNLPFLAIGLFGIAAVYKQNGARFQTSNHFTYLTFFVAVMLIGIGSAYYHLRPDNHTLLWDRLPMSMAFMALFSTIITEHFKIRRANLLLMVLLAIGFSSVLYWYWTEYQGAGDLRFYALVQFLPFFLIPALIMLYRSEFTRRSDILMALGFYLLAKLAEHFDAALFHKGNLLSGHTIKHLLAASSVFWILRMLRLREKTNA